jgi:patatin-like phospholipase/acyl hydrolase
MTSEPRFQALALSGGGYRGLYTARLLADLEEHLRGPIARRFDLLAGTSVGGILALALACEIPAARIVTLFHDHGAAIFARRSRWGYRKSLYSNEGLRTLLRASDLFADRRLADCTHPVIVPAINFTTGKPVLFKTAHHTTFVRDCKLGLVDAALATSAAPTYFPRHTFNSSQYVDGGLFANAPGLLAVHEAEFFFRRPIGEIHLLAVGTMSAKTTVDPRRNRDGGMLSWGGANPVNTPKQLFNLAISTQETLVDYMVGHRLGDRYCHLDDDLTDEQARAVGLDKVTPAASEVLIGTATERSKRALGDTRVQQFLAHQPSPAVFHHRPAQGESCSV